MHIVGIERSDDAEGAEAAVHTIDVWYSEKRRAWVVERLDATGNHVGVSQACGSRADALECLAEWLRAHPDSDLGAPVPDELVLPALRTVAARRSASREDARTMSRTVVRQRASAAVRGVIRRS